MAAPSTRRRASAPRAAPPPSRKRARPSSPAAAEAAPDAPASKAAAAPSPPPRAALRTPAAELPPNADAPATITSSGRDFISARVTGRKKDDRLMRAWADLLRAAPDEVAAATDALDARPPHRANDKADRAARLEAQFPVWREWLR